MWCSFHSIYLESKASTCFEHYFLIIRRCCTNSIWCIACVYCQLAVARLQQNCNRAYTKCRCATPPEDEQAMLETCRDLWFSINWMKRASRWLHYTDVLFLVSWNRRNKTVSNSPWPSRGAPYDAWYCLHKWTDELSACPVISKPICGETRVMSESVV
jgi:hypothetical protein